MNENTDPVIVPIESVAVVPSVTETAPETKKTEAVKVENMKITIEPKKSCKRCHGTGRIGFIEGDQNNPLVCNCVMKVYKKLQEDKKLEKLEKQKSAQEQKTTDATQEQINVPAV